MIKELLLFFTLVTWGGMLHAQNSDHEIRGQVLSVEGNSPLPGAIVRLGDSQKFSITDEEGMFTLEAASGTYLLKVTYLGMEEYEELISVPSSEDLVIRMEIASSELEEFTVMSTGYQDLPTERVTGSFVAVDRELLNRRVSTDFIGRLEDITPGLIFNRGPQTGRDQLSIRGRSTLFANTAPLIIVDNFPFDGALESINPNDIEQITVLKDAAAASIWGARAGNGVIVVTTRSGNKGTAPKISYNSTVNLFEEQDLYYVPQMGMGDFVSVEKRLFESGFYRSQELSASKPSLPQAVELLIAQRDGKISTEETESGLENLKMQDFRNDLQQYYYRPRVNQQHSLSVSGGGASTRYQFSMGYDKNLQGVKGNEDDRWTLQAKNSWSLFKDKLNWNAGIYLTKSRALTGTNVPQNYPYSTLADGQGNPVPIYTNYSSRYIESVNGQGLLNWDNIPLNEIGMLDYSNDRLEGRFQTALNYSVFNGLNAEVSYQYWSFSGRNRELNPQETYFVRDLVNKYTQQSEEGLLYRPIPAGDILDLGESYSYSHTLRGMLRYSKSVKGIHQITALLGSEVRDLQSESNAVRYYGYNDQLGTSSAMDYISRFPYYYNPTINSTIEDGTSHSGMIDRFLSFYGNAGYTFRQKLDATFSIRKDQSNFFGVNANQRGVPLWSAGLGWAVSQEQFASFLNGAYLKAKLSYGYSGNLDKSLSGRLTASYYNQPSYAFLPNIPGANINNPPNPNLSWEKLGIWNTGLVFESASSRFTGSLEVYGKRGMDLIGQSDASFSSGFLRVTSNYAETQTKGMDLVLGVDWLKGSLKWKTDLFYSHVKDKIVKIDIQQSASGLLNSFYNSSPVPVEGNPLFSVYSYAWAGLNPDNGNPQGFLDGEPSENYVSLISTATPESLIYHGSARPTDYGAVRNDLKWKGFSFSVNISYRFGYYYRKRSIDYFSLLRGQIGHGDFEKRWQAPGDELSTYVPSLPLTANSTRNIFYSNSSALIEKGDHIRLQDIRMGYTFEKSKTPWIPFGRAEIYCYANNLGIIWKATSDELDPDFQTAAPLKSLAFGLRIDL